MPNLFAVVLAGGSGTRFWPASRKSRPKQLLALAPGDPQSLIAATIRRIEPLCPPERVLVATGAHLVDATRRALPWLPESAFLGEPVPRNTAPCIAWASSLIHRRDPEALVMVLPSDHYIGDEPGFRAIVERAVDSARTAITTIGIEPARPETGYGYIEAAEELAPGVRRVARFVEKPDRARAEEYVASGRYFWNSGMFFFRASEMLDAVRAHLPELAAGLERLEIAGRSGAAAEERELAELFPRFPAISIDYGVMERASRLHVVPGSFDWNDLGSWQSAWELANKDGDGNALDPGALSVRGRGNLVRDLRTTRTPRIVALAGVDDLCVIETDDALLIIPRERAQEVRLVVEALEQAGKKQLL